MGFNGAALAAFVPFLTFYALFIHANVSWSYGPFRYLIASPAFHRWHHTTEEEGLGGRHARCSS
jgi:sterol desaturase/sphingolipid hydroxylase (fatty acid hydroxylase superfamily)